MQEYIFTPVSPKKYDIYDIFYNDNGEYVLIKQIIPKKNFEVKLILNDSLYDFKLLQNVGISIYTVKAPKNNTNTVLLKINNDEITVKINNYPIFENEIIMSTMVKNEDNYIKEWINYHSKLGVNRFIIYDNAGINDGISYSSKEKKSNLKLVLKDYINEKKVVLIKWPYKKRLFRKNNPCGQTGQQNHSLYLFRNSKYIGFLDIDEYLNPIKKIENINTYFDELIVKNKINIDKISSFRFKNRYFYNPNNKNVSGTNFLKIFNCDKINNDRKKHFVIPKNTNVIKIHWIIDGLPFYEVNHTDGYLNHYFYLNKNNRGKNKTGLIDNSILNNI